MVLVATRDGAAVSPQTTVIDGSLWRPWIKGCTGQSVPPDNVTERNKALRVTIEGPYVTNGSWGVVEGQETSGLGCGL